MRGGYQTLLQHIAECLRAGFKKVEAIQSHPLEKPMPEVPEVKAVAEATGSDSHEFTAWPKHLRGGCKKESVDIRLAVDDVLHHPRIGRSLGNLEVRWVYD